VSFLRWLRSLVLHRRLERDMREEMRQHLERATERLMARGLSREEARRAALQEFGNVDYLQEQARDVRGTRWLGALSPDAKLALRMLVKNPLLSVVGGLGMAVAIAIATGLFTFMRFYYSDAPVEDGDRVVTVEYVRGDENHSTLFDYQVWKEELESIEDLAAFRTVEGRRLESPISASAPADVAEMTASGFRVARVPPLLGRPLLDSDEVEGAAPVVVIGYREWHERFAADPSVVGSQVRLDGIPHTVVGVMPEGFRLPVNHGVWTPMATGTPVAGPEGGARIHVFGRLAPGVEAAAAEAEAAAIGERMIAEHPQVYERLTPVVRPYIRHLFDVQTYPAWAIWLMQLFGALILVAIAVNVAVLFYARTAIRRAEITVRTALGASRSRIVTQLFLEALALTAVAAVLGVLIAQIGYRQLVLLKLPVLAGRGPAARDDPLRDGPRRLRRPSRRRPAGAPGHGRAAPGDPARDGGRNRDAHGSDLDAAHLRASRGRRWRPTRSGRYRVELHASAGSELRRVGAREVPAAAPVVSREPGRVRQPTSRAARTC
jgi:hypothetical protein